ncbi:pimeloyl-ACP methyl ester esterase BioH [uncultured Tolumonas sp.]|uniref:pimeloyl-ACP methyl ester esterase BioH n=1 Tax=uncultured Tolumonas sp. TaxID=263765 RepID=UPI002931150E|nr:pimeloyl-ACP methyl ester esterase BioH [uncultured Tolumonas sp.]
MYIERIGQGPDLVLLHGWGLNSAVWQEIVPPLEPYYTLHLVDLPGFGFSQHTIVESADLSLWSEAVLPHLPAQFNLLGWSMGGLIALRMALDHPTRIQRLVLMGSSPCFLQQENWPGIRPDVLSGFNRALQLDTRKTIERFLAIQAMGSESVKEDVKRLKNWLQQRPDATPAALKAGLQLLETVDLRTELAQLNCPVMSLYGRLDSLVPVAAVAEIESLLPECRSVIFPHAAHTPFLSHPQLFIEALHQFID